MYLPIHLFIYLPMYLYADRWRICFRKIPMILSLGFAMHATERFYDFLFRKSRVPIHFQTWFSSVKSTLPSSDQLIEIKIWELGLVTRSIVPPLSR
ncbi:unnamed protein product [Rotaria socialis]|uniref:Uncharacterized protein n=1 Tax=Rotaria socialis TaxID=392032 RepID=A0A821R941_9BILA|nr:unnamed protein product [Rotaria socialis]CAF4470717.1 unnamed protein product [Rotaria socialis]CAF4839617.1 unnamed protein product [Rotaria socialis]CAF5003185.1 unnamed protein product [Rotaria socialis]